MKQGDVFRVAALLTCAALALSLPASGAPSSRPNVLFILTDDQSSDTIHALGNDVIQTPTLDRLLSEGLVFNNAYIMGGSSPAVCSPSRA